MEAILKGDMATSSGNHVRTERLSVTATNLRILGIPLGGL